MGLLEDYEAADLDFCTMLVAALSKSATDLLLDANFPTDPQYTQKAKFIKACLSSTPAAVRFVARALVSQGITKGTPEPTIQTQITDKFEYLAILFDPTLEL